MPQALREKKNNNNNNIVQVSLGKRKNYVFVKRTVIKITLLIFKVLNIKVLMKQNY